MTTSSGPAATGDAAEKLERLVGPILSEAGYDLEELTAGPTGEVRAVRVIVDRDGGIGLDELAQVSRQLSEALDETDLFGEQAYDLEVSTPGIGRPLSLPRHWRRARGRKVAVRLLVDGAKSTVQGRVAEIDDDTVALLHNDKGRMRTQSIPFADIESAKIEVDFTRPGEAELRRCGLDDDEIARRRTPAS
ncbi:ribosome maturation factor RimP [Gordonia alkaliphila]|uniref:Ribosome maturation factor RimP n=1 Tax=Gordonia alkaliphila TaxID=1053547 RepID=A0ABP8YZA8_9ACTN|nr:ribosome maturation factor RimP [Gordonia alkaliphila]MCK0440385.1 ribosome maturation factor RimP [Gordonia alkaliphila]